MNKLTLKTQIGFALFATILLTSISCKVTKEGKPNKNEVRQNTIDSVAYKKALRHSIEEKLLEKK